MMSIYRDLLCLPRDRPNKKQRSSDPDLKEFIFRLSNLKAIREKLEEDNE